MGLILVWFWFGVLVLGLGFFWSFWLVGWLGFGFLLLFGGFV